MVEISIGMSKWLTFLTSKCPKIWFTASVVLDRNFFFSNLFQWFTQLLVKESTQHFDLVENFLHLKVTRKYCPVLTKMKEITVHQFLFNNVNKILIANVCPFIWFLFTPFVCFMVYEWILNNKGGAIFCCGTAVAYVKIGWIPFWSSILISIHLRFHKIFMKYL